jgi:hypothetical protein
MSTSGRRPPVDRAIWLSDLGLFGDLERIVDLDAEIAHSAL